MANITHLKQQKMNIILWASYAVYRNSQDFRFGWVSPLPLFAALPSSVLEILPLVPFLSNYLNLTNS